MCRYFRSVRTVEVDDSRLLASPLGVDAAWYRQTYPDIGIELDPLVHYSDHGWREGRDPNSGFSAEWYRKAHPAVPAHVDPFLHYLRDGRRCGWRRAPHDYRRPEAWTREHGGVDPAFYRARYGHDDPAIDAATHYTTRGWREGRDPNATFSTSWYLARNPDIAAAGIDPFHHYLASGMAEGRRARPTLIETIRFHEWWSHKFSSFMAVAYLTAVMLGVSIASLGPLLLVMLGALTCTAAYVSLINDLCDRTVDRLGGKANRMQGRSPGSIALLLAACVLPGAGFAWVWRHDPLVLALYLGSWLSFTLYSLPPVRLKYRGLLGALADAAGAHVFPTLLVTVLVLRWVGAPIDRIWFALAGTWALGYGLRGILYHQQLDLRHDAEAGMRTFSAGLSAGSLRRFVVGCILPVEAAALLGLLLLSRCGVAVLVVLACMALEASRRWALRPLPAVAGQETAKHPALFGCYEVQLPLALLLASALVDPAVLAVAAVHAALFWPHRMRRGTWLASARRVPKIALRLRQALRPKIVG